MEPKRILLPKKLVGEVALMNWADGTHVNITCSDGFVFPATITGGGIEISHRYRIELDPETFTKIDVI